jgi:cleavage stimulation factor subunit 3
VLVSCLLDPLADNFLGYLLTFAYSGAQEIKKESADVHATYDKFLTLQRSHLETFEQTTTSENTSAATVPTNSTGNAVVNNNHAPATIEAGIQATPDIHQ